MADLDTQDPGSQAMQFLLVKVTVWLAVATWCLGVRSWLRSRSIVSERRRAGAFWLTGATLLLIHIVASYGFVHRWSHEEALRATAEQSAAVTGVAAPWGVYVNFIFSIAWLAVSAHLLNAGSSRHPLEWHFFALSVLIVGSATIVFEAGPVRWMTLIAFLWLAWDTWRTHLPEVPEPD